MFLAPGSPVHIQVSGAAPLRRAAEAGDRRGRLGPAQRAGAAPRLLASGGGEGGARAGAGGLPRRSLSRAAGASSGCRAALREGPRRAVGGGAGQEAGCHPPAVRCAPIARTDVRIPPAIDLATRRRMLFPMPPPPPPAPSFFPANALAMSAAPRPRMLKGLDRWDPPLLARYRPSYRAA